ncbi:MAG TPA: Nramp family divalent metal transporter [Pirellulaceae bacterium]|jgi:Mn2+/Fe2+ NRAMP family transporter|nr:Nramp family divalent metal transporter [Pirellulaceae bacterium]
MSMSSGGGSLEPDDSSTIPAPAQVAGSTVSMVEEPPRNWLGIAARMGPGMIVAGSIVGSGELIATTSTGAQAGFTLLWLILLGCVIKVFAQVELGRYSISSGKTTMEAMAEVPGPSIPRRGNWLVWYWLAMFVASIAQLGGIVGSVGQSLAISVPLTETGRVLNELAYRETELKIARQRLKRTDADSPERSELLQTLVEAEATRAAAASGAMSFYEKHDAENAARYRSVREASESLRLETTRVLGERIGTQTDALAEYLLELSEASELTRRADSKSDPLAAIARLEGIAAEEGFDGLAEAYFEVDSLPEDVKDRMVNRDDRLWAALVTVVTMMLLVIGRYALIQHFSTALVAGFTFMTIVNVILLQFHPTWSVSWSDLASGLSFQLPPSSPGVNPVFTALATFGIIGVGASELVTYPYWCLEKGYGRFAGPRSDKPEWAERARGWIRVMQFDAWGSAVVYTFATIAFYLLGAAILFPLGLDPKGSELIRQLSAMYRPVFGELTQGVFLFGAFAVLYSTFFVANASHARVFSDALRVMSFVPDTHRTRTYFIRLFSGLFPLLCLTIYLFLPEPRRLVLISGVVQGLMLPMLAGAAVYFRYRKTDERIRPRSRAWDALLWLSFAGMLITGLWTAFSHWLK